METREYSDEEKYQQELKAEKEAIKKKRIFTYDEYQLLLKNKLKQGKTYTQAKRELAIEQNLSNKKREELKEKIEKEEKDKEENNVSEKFRREFNKMLGRK